MRRLGWICLVTFTAIGCGGGGAAAPGKTAQSESGSGKTPAASTNIVCGDEQGIYALPASSTDLEANGKASEAAQSFREAEEAYNGGNTSGASKKFLEAVRALAQVPSQDELGEWARYAREVSYHNALWSAAAAGQLTELRKEIDKSASDDATLADAINEMLVDPPTECEKH